MKHLNRQGAKVAVKDGISSMTDITGFGLAGHALKMAEASQTSLRIQTEKVPLLPGAYQVYEKGSIPGATFRNQEFTGDRAHFTRNVDYNLKMLVHDAQTSGGLLMAVNPDHAMHVVQELNIVDPLNNAAIIGEVLNKSPRSLYFE